MKEIKDTNQILDDINQALNSIASSIREVNQTILDKRSPMPLPWKIKEQKSLCINCPLFDIHGKTCTIDPIFEMNEKMEIIQCKSFESL